jgi:hypothetical protein
MRNHDEWHPLYAAHEGPAGTWTMVDPQGRPYGTIIARRDLRTYQTQNEVGILLGYSPTLRDAVELIHQHWVLGHAPMGPVNGK